MFGTTLTAGALAVLQTVGPFEGIVEVGLIAYELVGAALGLFIAYLAYRGYRRNDSRPMLFIAIGFLLTLLPGVLLFVVLVVIPSLSPPVVQALTQTFEIFGLLAIIYALRMDT